MTDTRILQKALEKAARNGYDFPMDENTAQWLWDSNQEYEHIFNHDFAKAFWGEEDVCSSCGEVFEETHTVGGVQYKFPLYGCACGYDADPSRESSFEYRLKEMVLAENPIKYLEPFIQDNAEKGSEEL